MSADIAAKLRLLAQDYQDGRLDLAAYRALRAPLLDSLVENVYSIKAAMDVTQPRMSARAVDLEVTQPGKPLALPREPVRMSANSGNTRPSKISNTLWIVGGLIVAAIVIAAVLIPRYEGRRDGNVSDDASSTSSDAAAAEAVRRLVDAFTDRGDWSEGRLASLNVSLLETGGARMAAASREAWFQRFVDELRRRLKEQQALAIAPLTANDSPLAALAVTVGLDLNSPDAAIHIVAVTGPAAAERGTDAGASTGAGVNARAELVEPASRAQPEVTSSREGMSTEPRADESPAAVAPSGVAPRIASQPGAHASVPISAPASNTSDTSDPCRLELIRSRRPVCQDTLPSGIDAPPMAMIPAGAFDMGSTAAPEEQPVHRVTIRTPFAISVYEVSQGEFRQFCEQTHRTCEQQPWDGDDYPVVNVSWDDARAYADWLSSATRRHYSLPTEAQWEYAARAGQTGPFPSGDTLSPTDAHYSVLTKQTTAARRSQKFNANAFRLVHVLGNVREWVDDAWVPSFAGASNEGAAVKATLSSKRVARGGSYADSAARLRLSMREELTANTRDTRTGFRIVRELPPG